MAYHRILTIVACTIQQGPVVYPPLYVDSTTSSTIHNS